MLHYLVMNTFKSLNFKRVNKVILQKIQIIYNPYLYSQYPTNSFLINITQKNKFELYNDFLYNFYLNTSNLKLVDKPKLLYNYMLYKYLANLLYYYTGFSLT